MPAHGAYSPARSAPVARAQKRRFLARNGLRASELDAIAAAFLDNWARAAAKVDLMDTFFREEGFLDEKGEPRAAAKVYFVALNSARHALVRLEANIDVRHRQPRQREPGIDLSMLTEEELAKIARGAYGNGDGEA
jgi:hypothetical protein